MSNRTSGASQASERGRAAARAYWARVRAGEVPPPRRSKATPQPKPSRKHVKAKVEPPPRQLKQGMRRYVDLRPDGSIRFKVERYELAHWEPAHLRSAHANAERWLKQPDLAAEVKAKLKRRPKHQLLPGWQPSSPLGIDWSVRRKPVSQLTPAELKRELNKQLKRLREVP